MKIGINPTLELFTNNIKVIIPDKHTLILNGSANLIGEEIVYRFKKMPEKLLYQYNHSGSKIKKALKKELVNQLLFEAVDSVRAQKIESVGNPGTYLTSNLIEKNLLSKFENKLSVGISDLVSENIPVLQGVSIDRILAVRDKYSESFSSFQQKISDLLAKSNMFENQEEFNVWVNNQLSGALNDLRNIQSDAVHQLARKSISVVAKTAIAMISTSKILTNSTMAELWFALSGCVELGSEILSKKKEIEKMPSYFYYKFNEK